MPNVREVYGDQLTYCDQPMETLDGADALAIMTEWKQFVNPNFDQMKTTMREPVVFDGRNLYDPQRMHDAGFTYHSIGRRSV